jgi:hypothetical protein
MRTSEKEGKFFFDLRFCGLSVSCNEIAEGACLGSSFRLDVELDEIPLVPSIFFHGTADEVWEMGQRVFFEALEEGRNAS